MIVHPKFTKSYAYNTFVTLNNLGVEVKIFDGSSEIVQWIQKSLRVSFLNAESMQNVIEHCLLENVCSEEAKKFPGKLRYYLSVRTLEEWRDSGEKGGNSMHL